MGAAFPVVSAGIGVAGGITSMFERSAEERRQRDLIRAQLQANQTAQDAQIASIMTGRVMALNNYMTENAARLQQFQSSVMQHSQAAMQAQGQYISNAVQSNLKQTSLQNQQNAAESQIFAKETQYKNAANQAQMEGINQQGQISEQASRMFLELQQALREGNQPYAEMLSAMLANEMGPQVSDATQARAKQQGQREMQTMLQMFNDAENMSEQAMQQRLLSDEFAKLLDDIGLYEGTTGRSEINYALGSMINELNTNRQVSGIQYQTLAKALQQSLEMQPTQFQIDQLQGDMNFGAGMSQSIGQAANYAANNIQQQAQLLRSMPQQQSTLGGILNIASAAMPLGSLFFSSPSVSRQQPLAIDITKPLLTMPEISLTRPLVTLPY